MPQVDKEKEQNLLVSGFMDVRDDVSLAKLQVGFVKFVVQVGHTVACSPHRDHQFLQHGP